MTGEELVFASRGNVVIDTLQAGSLGLPIVAEPIYKVEHEPGIGASKPVTKIKPQIEELALIVIEILHPGVLLLTKMQRWYQNRESTRPKTVTKSHSDKNDLDYLVSWLAENDMTIEFEKYRGKTKDQLLEYVRAYLISTKAQDLMQDLKAAMKPDDWESLSLLTSTSESQALVTTTFSATENNPQVCKTIL